MSIAKSFTSILVGMAAAVSFAPPSVTAQDAEYAELFQRLEALEAQRAGMRSEFASFGLAGSEQKGIGCDGCGKGSDNCCCPSRAWYAGYELTILRPHLSDVDLGNLSPFVGPVNGFDNAYGAGHRFIIGAQNDYGLGARIRYWMFNHGHEFTPPAVNTLNINVDALDGELTLARRLCNWDLLVSGGARYGRKAYKVGDPAAAGALVYFEGVGPTVSIQATRDIGCRGFYGIGNFRTSLLFGEIQNPGRGFGPILPAPRVSMMS